MKNLTFSEYEVQAGETACYPRRGDNLTYPALGLNGEAGEVAEKVKKVIRDQGGVVTPATTKALQKEVGDCLWYLAALAHELGFSLEDAARGNLEKLASRKERGTIQGSGDDR